MILDRLEEMHRYASVHPRVAAACAALARLRVPGWEQGQRIDIEGDSIYALPGEAPGKAETDARLEIHRAYIDVQYCVDGVERIGWRPLGSCKAPEGQYDESRDILFFQDRPQAWITMLPGTVAVFFPEDAHAPMVGEGTIRKIVIKVLL